MTLIRKIDVYVTDKEKFMEPDRATVRFTSDSVGESLSIEHGGKMIFMRFRDLMKIIVKERAFQYKNSHLIIEDQGDWIPVPKLDWDEWFREPVEGMPRDGELILVTARDRKGNLYVDKDECYIEDVDGDLNYDLCEAWRDWDDVLAWMPLPKPYQEPEQEQKGKEDGKENNLS